MAVKQIHSWWILNDRFYILINVSRKLAKFSQNALCMPPFCISPSSSPTSLISLSSPCISVLRQHWSGRSPEELSITAWSRGIGCAGRCSVWGRLITGQESSALLSVIRAPWWSLALWRVSSFKLIHQNPLHTQPSHWWLRRQHEAAFGNLLQCL